MDPEVSDGWSKIDGVRTDGFCKIGDEQDEGLPCKIGEERDGLSHKIVEKSDEGKIEEELVRNELLGSTEKGRFESRITDPWCGSRVAGWRVAAGKTTVLIGVLSLLTSGVFLVPKWLRLSENWIPK